MHDLPDESSPSVTQRPRILIVEDSRTLQDTLVRCLEPDYEAISAFDGVSGLAHARAAPPDLILLDIGLPNMNGERVLAEVRATHELRDVPILVVTGDNDPARRVRLLENGAKDFLEKPFRHLELRARVGNLVREKRTMDLLNEAIGRHESDLVTLAKEVASSHAMLQGALEQLEGARQEAESANRVKSDFLHVMAHELKTPVTAMQLQMKVLQRDPEVHLSPRLRAGLERIGRSTSRLLHLVDTVLEWARIESGRRPLSAEALPVGRLVNECVAEVAPYARRKGVGIEVRQSEDPPLVLRSDRRLVRLLIADIIARAVQTTAEGGIVVEIGPADSDSLVRIAVRDCGPSIPVAQRGLMFDPPGGRGRNALDSGSGSGLGLHVLRDLVEALDGRVRVEPHDGVGNTVVVELPSLPEDRTTARMRPPPPGPMPEDFH